MLKNIIINLLIIFYLVNYNNAKAGFLTIDTLNKNIDSTNKEIDSTANRIIEILNSDILGQEIENCIIDNISIECQIQILKGNVILKIDKTLIYADSIRINKQNNKLEAFNGIHIIDNKSTHIYGKRLVYLGKEKHLFIYEKVKVINQFDTLLTEELFYDRMQGLCEYKNNGKIISRNTKSTSIYGVYFVELKKMLLKYNVHIEDTSFNVYTDSIEYISSEAKNKIIKFISYSKILLNKGQKIYTDSGFYYTKEGDLKLYKYSKIIDSNKIITANYLQYNKNIKKGYAYNNFMLFDSSNDFILKGDTGIFDDLKYKFVVKNNCISIIVNNKKNDTFYIKSDNIIIEKINLKILDSIKKEQLLKNHKITISGLYKGDFNKISNKSNKINLDSLNESRKTKHQKLIEKRKENEKRKELEKRIEADKKRNEKNKSKQSKKGKIENKVITNEYLEIENKKLDTNIIEINKNIKDTLNIIFTKDTTIKLLKKIDSNANFKIIRIYNNVKIFNDSMQTICDSVWYSDYDSIMQLLKKPVVWLNIKNQLFADTINAYIVNNKVDSIITINNSFNIEHLKGEVFNQTKSKNMIFKLDTNKHIDYIWCLQDVNTIYFLENNNGKFISSSKINADKLKVNLLNNKPIRITYFKDTKGVTYPIDKLKKVDAYLENFKWQDSIRPKNKYEFIDTTWKIKLPTRRDFIEKNMQLN